MKIFLRIFGGLVAIFVVVGIYLDNRIEVSREIEIKASPQQIHALVSDLKQWPKWSPWLALDNTIKVQIGEVSKGIGASQTWSGKHSGRGALTLIGSSPTVGISYQLTFDQDPTIYTTEIRYLEMGANTKVTWTMRGKMKPIIIGNYLALMLDMFVGDSFSLGLSQLKKAVENNE